jgi:hypothetical protein
VCGWTFEPEVVDVNDGRDIRRNHGRNSESDGSTFTVAGEAVER